MNGKTAESPTDYKIMDRFDILLSNFSTCGSLMGTRPAVPMMIEGRIARCVYISLPYAQIALHG